MERRNESDDVFGYILLALCAGLVLSKKFLQLNLEEIKHSLLYASLYFLLYVVLPLLLICLVMRFLYRRKRKREEREGKIRQDILKIKNTKFHTSLEVIAAQEKISEFIDTPHIRKGNEDLLTETLYFLEWTHEGLYEREKQKSRELRNQRRSEIKNNELAEKLLKYFQEKKSAKAIPQWALSYSSLVIKDAKNKYDSLVRDGEEEQRKWDEVSTFVQENGAFPLNFGQLEKKEQQMYAKALKLLKEGKLEVKPIAVSDEDADLLEKRLFRVNELDPETRDRLIHQYGYRHKAFIYPTGKSGNNLIIKNDERKESDYHFCMKHLFAEIDKENAIVEYSKEGLRADVAFMLDGKKIAVEIETGSNKELQIANKVKWLNDNFDYWVFVCSRRNVKKYRKYCDNDKSFCLTLKDAYDKVSQFATGIIDDLDYNKPTAAKRDTVV